MFDNITKYGAGRARNNKLLRLLAQVSGIVRYERDFSTQHSSKYKVMVSLYYKNKEAIKDAITRAEYAFSDIKVWLDESKAYLKHEAKYHTTSLEQELYKEIRAINAISKEVDYLNSNEDRIKSIIYFKGEGNV